MIRSWCVLLLSALLGAQAFGEVRYGQVELSHFRMTGPDGKLRDYPTQGIVLPVRMERIQARLPGQPVPPKVFQGSSQDPLATLVYSNDRGTNYFATEEMPSALDDITILPVGNGQWWHELTLGIHAAVPNTVRIMNRQLGWTTYVQGRGTGVQAFDNLVFDVGWVFQPGQFPVGDWKYTIPIYQYWAQIPANNMPRVPNNLIYFAQQWRAYHVLGQGAFLEGQFAPVFSGDGPPTVGVSEDYFWFDWGNSQTPDGTYDETELDYYGGPPNDANFLMTLTTQQSGFTDTIRPSLFQWFRGRANGGNIGSLHFVDQNYLKGLKGLVLNPSEAPIQLISEGFGAASNLTALSLDLMTRVNSTGITQKVEAYNFVTNQYVHVDTRAASLTATRLTVGVPGTASQFVDAAQGNLMRLKVSFYQTGPATNNNWGADLDLVNWLATHP